MRTSSAIWLSFVACFTSSLNATVTMYRFPENRSPWFAAIDNDVATLDFTGYPENTIIRTQFAFSGVAFTDGTDRINLDRDFPNDGAGLYGATSDICVRFTQPMRWIAIDFPGSVAVDLYWHGALIYSTQDYLHNSEFLGFVSDLAFDEATFRYVSSSNLRIDDLHFGPGIAAPPPVTNVARIARQGQSVQHNGNSVTLGALRPPFANSFGQVGFTGDTTVAGDSFVWIDDGIAFLNSDEQNATLSGTESNIGISDSHGFAFSPLFNGLDSVYTHAGPLLVMGDSLPGNPPAFATTQVRWPAMTPTGSVYFISKYSSVPHGPVEGTALYRCADPSDPSTITRINGTGDLVDGFPIEPESYHGYDVSDDESFRIETVELDKKSEVWDYRLLVNAQVVVRMGAPTGQGDLWAYFRDMSINNRGDYIFGASTNLPPSDNNTVIGFNGEVALRKGMVVDGAGLGPAPSSLSINNFGKAVFMWHLNPAGEGLFYGDADDLPSAVAALRTGDLVDYTGDGVADAGVVDFNVATDHHCLSLSDHNFIYVEVDLLDVGTNVPYEAIIRVPLPAPPGDCPANIATGPGSETSVNIDDLLMVIGAWGPCPAPPASCPANIIASGSSATVVDIDDLLALISAWGPCPQ